MNIFKSKKIKLPIFIFLIYVKTGHIKKFSIKSNLVKSSRVKSIQAIQFILIF